MRAVIFPEADNIRKNDLGRVFRNVIGNIAFSTA